MSEDQILSVIDEKCKLINRVFVDYIINTTVTEEAFDNAVLQLKEECKEDRLFLLLFSHMTNLSKTVAEQRRKLYPLSETIEQNSTSPKNTTIDDVKREAAAQQQQRIAARLKKLKK